MTAIARTVNIPLLILTAASYEASLSRQLNHAKVEFPAKIIALNGATVQEVTQRASAHDMVIVTLMGSPGRFRSGLGRIPEQVATAISSSIVVIHYP